MITRLATQNDKDKVLRLLDEFSALLNANDTPSQVGGDIFDEIMSRNDIKIFVAEENGKLLGLATLYLLPIIRHGWHMGHVEDFFVSEKMRNKGVGTQIFTAIKEFCRQNNIKVIKLDSANELTKAHDFYLKNGGKQTEKMFRFDID